MGGGANGQGDGEPPQRQAETLAEGVRDRLHLGFAAPGGRAMKQICVSLGLLAALRRERGSMDKERMLAEELHGYGDYMRTTPHRLIPGLGWTGLSPEQRRLLAFAHPPFGATRITRKLLRVARPESAAIRDSFLRP
jgi:hypothetical protein